MNLFTPVQTDEWRESSLTLLAAVAAPSPPFILATDPCHIYPIYQGGLVMEFHKVLSWDMLPLVPLGLSSMENIFIFMSITLLNLSMKPDKTYQLLKLSSYRRVHFGWPKMLAP